MENLQYTTESDVIADLEDRMGSEGDHSVAERMYALLVENEGFVKMEWDGIYITLSEDDFFKYWYLAQNQ